MRHISRYLFALLTTFAAAALGSLLTFPQISGWYDAINKPPFTPPDWIFIPIWAILYICMAIALARIWNCKENDRRRHWLFAFGAQLLFGILWCVLFFSLHSLTLSVIDIIILWFAVVVLILDAWEIDIPSFWFLVPYFAWITFTLILNVAIWWVN